MRLDDHVADRLAGSTAPGRRRAGPRHDIVGRDLPGQRVGERVARDRSCRGGVPVGELGAGGGVGVYDDCQLALSSWELLSLLATTPATASRPPISTSVLILPRLGSGSPLSSATLAEARSRPAAAFSAARAAAMAAPAVALSAASCAPALARSAATAAPADAFSAAMALPSASRGVALSRASDRAGPALSTACSHAASSGGRNGLGDLVDVLLGPVDEGLVAAELHA